MSEPALARAGLDAVALKPAECDVSRARELPVDLVTVDYEGHEHVPARETLARLAREKRVRVTTPVRADGFDPLGDDSRWGLPDGVGRVLVAGHPAYLTDAERARAIAPRLGAARERDPDGWVGTEGIERVAMAAGGTQYDLLSGRTLKGARALRAAGFSGELVVYAPTVLTDDEDSVLDAVGAYAARRGPVRRALPDGGRVTGAAASGRTREVLSRAVHDYALVGSPATVRERVDALHAAGVDLVVGYPARGIEEFLR